MSETIRPRGEDTYSLSVERGIPSGTIIKPLKLQSPELPWQIHPLGHAPSEGLSWAPTRLASRARDRPSTTRHLPGLVSLNASML